MKTDFTPEERLLLALLRLTFLPDREEDTAKKKRETIRQAVDKEGAELKTLFAIAEAHGVTALLYQTFIDAEIPLEGALLQRVQYKSRATVLQNYRLLFLGKTIVEKLREQGVEALILKGSTTAAYYPVPELRKTGDLDLLLPDKEKLVQAEKLLQELGLQRDAEQMAHHHVSYKETQGIEIELHTMLAEPFASEWVNAYLARTVSEYGAHSVRRETMGVCLPCPDEGFHAYYLLLHMLQHFLRAGFGIKLFCDWVAFWREEKEETAKADFLRLAKESGLYGFAQMVTAACVAWLGLAPERVRFLFEEELTVSQAREKSRRMLLDVLEAEEFGRSGSDRMVVLQERGIRGYAAEFHHQMRLNFPKAGKVFPIWPILWGVTLVRFLRNNKRLQRGSARAILQKAGERSSMLREMKLFEPVQTPAAAGKKKRKFVH